MWRKTTVAVALRNHFGTTKSRVLNVQNDRLPSSPAIYRCLGLHGSAWYQRAHEPRRKWHRNTLCRAEKLHCKAFLPWRQEPILQVPSFQFTGIPLKGGSHVSSYLLVFSKIEELEWTLSMLHLILPVFPDFFMAAYQWTLLVVSVCHGYPLNGGNNGTFT